MNKQKYIKALKELINDSDRYVIFLRRGVEVGFINNIRKAKDETIKEAIEPYLYYEVRYESNSVNDEYYILFLDNGVGIEFDKFTTYSI